MFEGFQGGTFLLKQSTNTKFYLEFLLLNTLDTVLKMLAQTLKSIIICKFQFLMGDMKKWARSHTGLRIFEGFDLAHLKKNEKRNICNILHREFLHLACVQQIN